MTPKEQQAYDKWNAAHKKLTAAQIALEKAVLALREADGGVLLRPMAGLLRTMKDVCSRADAVQDDMDELGT